jgi:hypothetical protein
MDNGGVNQQEMGFVKTNQEPLKMMICSKYEIFAQTWNKKLIATVQSPA